MQKCGLRLAVFKNVKQPNGVRFLRFQCLIVVFLILSNFNLKFRSKIFCRLLSYYLRQAILKVFLPHSRASFVHLISSQCFLHSIQTKLLFYISLYEGLIGLMFLQILKYSNLIVKIFHRYPISLRFHQQALRFLCHQ